MCLLQSTSEKRYSKYGKHATMGFKGYEYNEANNIYL